MGRNCNTIQEAVILALRRLRLEDCKFKASLGYIQDPVSTKTNQNRYKMVCF
jgi:hypothetical protein